MDFISEPIKPDRGAFDPSMMATGLASVPAGFTWRDRHYDVVEVLEHVKVSTPERGLADAERYLRRQQFTVTLDTGATAVIYVERQTRRGASAKAARQRWFLYSISEIAE